MDRLKFIARDLTQAKECFHEITLTDERVQVEVDTLLQLVYSLGIEPSLS